MEKEDNHQNKLSKSNKKNTAKTKQTLNFIMWNTKFKQNK